MRERIVQGMNSHQSLQVGFKDVDGKDLSKTPQKGCER